MVNVKQLGLTVGLSLLLLAGSPLNAFAMAHASGAHVSAGGHVSASHATVSHTTTATHATVSHGVASEGMHATTSRPATSTKPITSKETVKSVQENKTPGQSRTVSQASRTSTYQSLKSPSQRQSYLNWHSDYSDVTNPVRYFTSICYFWMPGNIWNSAMRNYNDDQLSQTMIEQARNRHYKWIKVGSKMVAVPEKVYQKIHVGDTVKLIDNQHISINGHVY